MKYCPRCTRNLQLEAFGYNVARPDGRQSECKTCRASYARKYRKACPEAVSAAKKKYRARG